MSYNRKWKPSRTAAKEFAEKMDEIHQFCIENGISQSARGDSYYFSINGQKYRVSNHTKSRSDSGMYGVDPLTGEYVKVRESYHSKFDNDEICITASKTRLIEIYNNLASGKSLDKRGYII